MFISHLKKSKINVTSFSTICAICLVFIDPKNRFSLRDAWHVKEKELKGFAISGEMKHKKWL